MLIRNILIILFFIFLGWFVYFDQISSEGAACREAGGRRYIEGCFRLEMIKLY